MKKYLIILISLLLFVVACGNDEDVIIAHENISEEVMNDANQVIAIIDEGREYDEVPELEDLFVFTDKYITGLSDDSLELTEEEFQLVMFAGAMVSNVHDYFDGSRDFLYDADRFYKILESGEYEERKREDEEVEQVDDQEAEKEIYAKMINSLLNEYDVKYEGFDVEKGVNLYKLIQSVALVNVSVIEDKKEDVLKGFEGDEYKIYSNFLDEVVELEELFNDLGWE